MMPTASDPRTSHLFSLIQPVLQELRARSAGPLRVLSWEPAPGTGAGDWQSRIAPGNVARFHRVHPDPATVQGLREVLSATGESSVLHHRWLLADPMAIHSGIAPGCYDVAIYQGDPRSTDPDSTIDSISRLCRFVHETGVVVLPQMRDEVRAAIVAHCGLRPFRPGDTEVFRAQGTPRPPCIDDLAGRRVIAICGMPRAGTTFLCDAVRTFGPPYGLFVTPRFWMSPIKLEEGARLNAINDDPDSKAEDFIPVLRAASEWYCIPEDLGLVCKLPQLVWRPDLLRCFSTVIMTVRPIECWLDSALRYRDTVMHAAGPAAWLPTPVQQHLREHFDGDFLREYGLCTMQQVEQLDDVLDVQHAVCQYGDRDSMRAALDMMGLPGEQVVREMWQGSRWRAGQRASGEQPIPPPAGP